jgi:hypothetical protein
MSEHTELTAAPRSGLLEDYQLSPFTRKMLAEVEQGFVGNFYNSVLTAASQFDNVAADLLLKHATASVAAGVFDYGSEGFDTRCFQLSSLPLLTWIAAKPVNPKLTLREVEEKVLALRQNDRLRYRLLRRGVLELMGFRLAPLPKPETAEQPSP